MAETDSHNWSQSQQNADQDAHTLVTEHSSDQGPTEDATGQNDIRSEIVGPGADSVTSVADSKDSVRYYGCRTKNEYTGGDTETFIDQGSIGEYLTLK